MPSITTIAFGSTRHFDRVPLFIFRNSFVIPSLSGLSATRKLSFATALLNSWILNFTCQKGRALVEIVGFGFVSQVPGGEYSCGKWTCRILKAAEGVNWISVMPSFFPRH